MNKSYSNSYQNCGEIVLKDKNSWRYSDSKEYNYNPNDLKDWKFLDFN